MAHNVYVYGLSDAGFRSPKAGGGYGHISGKGTTQVDIDDVKTQLKLNGERDNFVRVSGSGSTTAVIVGLSRRGFRIPRSSDGAYVMVKLGGGAVTVDLTKGKVRQILRRSKRDWVAASDPTSVAVRGTQNEQAGFELRAAGTATLTGDNTGNATNGKTVTVGPTTYTIKTSLTEVRSTGTITTSGTGAANNDTVTVGGTTYTFKTTLTGAANEVLRTGVEDVDLTNLASAINGTSGAGTTYGTGTVAQPYVTAGAVTSHAITITGKVGSGTNGNVALAKTGSVITVSGANATGGVNPVANEVHIGGSADATLTNLSEAINAGANPGVDYSSNTVVNPDFSASAVASHVITLSDKIGGADTETLTTNETTYTFGALGSGVTKVYRGVTATVNASLGSSASPNDSFNYQQLRRHYKSWIEA